VRGVRLAEAPRNLIKKKQTVIHEAQNTARLLVVLATERYSIETKVKLLQRLEPLQERERSRDVGIERDLKGVGFMVDVVVVVVEIMYYVLTDQDGRKVSEKVDVSSVRLENDLVW